MISKKRQQAPQPHRRDDHRIEDAKALDLRETALRLGLTLGRGGKTMFCPAGHGRGPGSGTPSVSLFVGSDGLGAWNCQACDAGGSVLDLVMVARGCDLPEAIDLLLGDSIPLPPDPPKLAPLEAAPEVSRADRARAVTAFLSPLSLTSTGREWLVGRGLDPDAADAAGVVDTTERLDVAFASAVDAVGEESVIALGLGKPKDERLRCSWPGGWLLWPYRSPSGAPLTMQGRALDPDNAIRWRHLRGGVPAPWGLDDLSGERVWIVEGCTDALSVRQWGESAIGLPGTSWLSADRAVKLAGLLRDRSVIVALDADAAGREAQPIIAARLTAAGCSVETVEWGDHEGDWCDWWLTHDDFPAVSADKPPDVWDPPLFDLGDEVELGQHLAKRLGGDERVVYDEDAVWRLRGRTWERQDDLALERMAQDYSGCLKRGPLKKGEPTVTPIKLSSRTCGGIVQAARTWLHRPGWFSGAPFGAAFGRHFARVDEDRVVIEPLTPKHRVRSDQVSPFDLPLGSCSTPVFWRLLEETWAGCGDIGERIRYLFEWLGLALVGLTTAHKASPLLVGHADTGKSVILGAMASCFPSSSRRAIPLQAMRREYDRAALVGARINFVSELPAREVLDGEAAKAIMVGDPVSARQPMGRVFTLRSRCGHVFAANKLPPVMDRALQKRFVLLDCPHVVAADQQDVDLPRKVAEEAPALALLGLRALEDVLSRGRILRPPSSAELGGEWVMASDPVAAWVREGVRKSKNRIASSALYCEYRSWCERNGHSRPLASNSWAERMRELGFGFARDQRSWWLAELVGSAEAEADARWGARGLVDT